MDDDRIFEELEAAARYAAEIEAKYDCNSCWGSDYGLGEDWR